MSRSLIENAEKPDENLNFHRQGKTASRAQSVAGDSNHHTDTENTRIRGSVNKITSRQHSRAQSETGSINNSELEYTRNRSNVGSIGRTSQKQRSRIHSEEVYSDMEQPKVRGADTGRPGSALSESTSARAERRNRTSRNTSRATSTAGSIRKVSNWRNQTPSVHDEPRRLPQYNSNLNSSEHISNVEETEGDDSTIITLAHPGGCAFSKLGRLLLSEYAVPTILWLACQVIAVIVISLLADIVTYKSLVQVTNIDSMIAHIGMYTSVVNSYLVTHAQYLSQSAQETMIQEFNLHLHHIAKVKAIFENDLVSLISYYLCTSY